MKAEQIIKNFGVEWYTFEKFLEQRTKYTKGFGGYNIPDEDLEQVMKDYQVFLAELEYAKHTKEDGSNDLWDEEKKKAMAEMLITSGFTFDGYRITKYSGYISGDDAVAIDRGVSVLGINSTSTGSDLTDALVKIRRRALVELKEAAYDLGCNAVIGVDFDYLTLEPETASLTGNKVYLPYVICVTANGNAVIIEKE